MSSDHPLGADEIGTEVLRDAVDTIEDMMRFIAIAQEKSGARLSTIRIAEWQTTYDAAKIVLEALDAQKAP